MKNLRRNFERFCLRNRNKGIPNLMLYICIGNAVVYLMNMFKTDPQSENLLYSILSFDRVRILSGEVWRLFTYPLTTYSGMSDGLGIILVAISLFCFYSIGTVIERSWGTLKFNLFYLSGVLMMDIFCIIVPGCQANASQLNTSLFLAYATMFPNATFLFMMIIPVRAWVFALLDLVLIIMNMIQLPFPYTLFPLIAIANYLLFFGKDVLNVIPLSWQNNVRKLFHVKPRQPKVIQFHVTQKPQEPKQNYNHRCTVCGRTDVTNPELEFRYCSKCKGYYCYCQDHINNHVHIQ